FSSSSHPLLLLLLLLLLHPHPLLLLHPHPLLLLHPRPLLLLLLLPHHPLLLLHPHPLLLLPLPHPLLLLHPLLLPLLLLLHPLLHPLPLLLFLLFVFLLQVTAHAQIFYRQKIGPLIAAKIGRSAKSADFFPTLQKKKMAKIPKNGRPNSPLTIRKSADFIFGRKIGRFSTHLWPA
ncbi:unnamed protein product, partial [Staurois parvus]